MPPALLRALSLAAGILLLLPTLPFIHFEALLFLSIPALWIAHRTPGLSQIISSLLGKMKSLSPLVFYGGIYSAFFIAVLLLKEFLFHSSPVVQDNFSQIWQARVFLLGKIKWLTPPFPEFFTINDFFAYIIFDGPHSYSYYFLLPCLFWVPFLILGIETYAVPLLAIGNLELIRRILRGNLAEIKIRVFFLILIQSPFFLLITTSFYNHHLTLFLFLSGLFFFKRGFQLNHSPLGNLFLSGLSVGLMASCRPVPALWVLMCIPLFGWININKIQSLKGVKLAFLSFIFGIFIGGLTFPGYNLLTTGHVLKAPISKSFEMVHSWVPNGELVFNEFVQGVREHIVTHWRDPFKNRIFEVKGWDSKLNNFYLSTAYLSFHLLGWPGISLPFLLLGWAGFGKKGHFCLIALFLLGFLHIFGYPFTGRTLGPRYYFEAIPFALFLVVQTLFWLRKSMVFVRYGLPLVLLFQVYSWGFYYPLFMTLVKNQPFSRVNIRLGEVIKSKLPQNGQNKLIFCEVGYHWPVFLSLFYYQSPEQKDPILFARDLGDRNQKLIKDKGKRDLFFLKVEKQEGRKYSLSLRSKDSGEIQQFWFPQDNY